MLDPRKDNTIEIDGNSNIVIQDSGNGNITINPANSEETLAKLKELNEIQLAALKEVSDKNAGRLGELFQILLDKQLEQKNVVNGNISNVEQVNIGDRHYYVYHYHEAPKAPLITKKLTANIYKRSKKEVIGRETELADLHERLFDNRQVVLVNGIGGVGKTTLAQLYLDEYWDEYRHVAWITLSKDGLFSDFAKDKLFLQMLEIDIVENEKAEETFYRIIKKLVELNESPSLLILDNAEADLSEKFSLLPTQPQWHMLVTSREKIEHFELKELGFLSEEEAIELFLFHYKREEIKIEEIKELVNIVDKHTLTIEILAKTAHRRRIKPAKLNTAIEDDLEANVYINHKGDKVDKITSYICTIFKTGQLDEDELWMMKQFACLPSKYHSEEELIELIAPAVSEKEKCFFDILSQLKESGWLLEDEENSRYKMHLIICEVVKRLYPIKLEEVRPLLKSITGMLSIDQTKTNIVDIVSQITYGIRFFELFSDSNDLELEDFLNKFIMKLRLLPEMNPQKIGDYEKLKELFEKVIHYCEKKFGKEHKNTASIYFSLAWVFCKLGDCGGARELLEKALRSDVENFGEEHSDMLTTYSNQGLELFELGDYEGARELLEKALRSDVKNFGEEHPATAIRYTNLGLVLKNLGDYVGARELLEKALRSDEKIFGEEHPTTAISQSNLANVLQALGDYDGARSLLERALHSDEKAFGKEHPTTAIRYTNLGSVLNDLGDYEGARDLLERALRSNEKSFGTEHPTTAISYSNLGLVLQDLGDYEGARSLLEKALRSNEKSLGCEHPTTATAYSNLGSVLQALGDYEGARSLLEKALRSDEKSFGTEYPTTAISYYNLASVLYTLGDYERALELLSKAYLVYKNCFGDDHPHTRLLKDNLDAIKKAME